MLSLSTSISRNKWLKTVGWKINSLCPRLEYKHTQRWLLLFFMRPVTVCSSTVANVNRLYTAQRKMQHAQSQLWTRAYGFHAWIIHVRMHTQVYMSLLHKPDLHLSFAGRRFCASIDSKQTTTPRDLIILLLDRLETKKNSVSTVGSP